MTPVQRTKDPTVRLSSENRTEIECLQELLKRLQDRHVECAQAVAKKTDVDAVSTATVTPDAQNVLQTMIQLDLPRSAKTTTTTTVKRARTHDTTGNDHKECDEKSSDDWDLSDYRSDAVHNCTCTGCAVVL